jgi:hypothetical protein
MTAKSSEAVGRRPSRFPEVLVLWDAALVLTHAIKGETSRTARVEQPIILLRKASPSIVTS